MKIHELITSDDVRMIYSEDPVEEYNTDREENHFIYTHKYQPANFLKEDNGTVELINCYGYRVKLFPSGIKMIVYND